nr:MAG TPA: hypothetical protein [Caudoviricetes sp.]
MSHCDTKPVTKTVFQLLSHCDDKNIYIIYIFFCHVTQKCLRL